MAIWWVSVLIRRLEFTLLPIRISAGIGRPGPIGVVLRHRRAKAGSLLPCFAFCSTDLNVQICLCMNPFDLGYLGDGVA